MLCLFTGSADAQSENPRRKQEMFEQVFGRRKQPAERDLTIPVVIDQRRKSWIVARAGRTRDAVRVAHESLDVLVEPALRAELRGDLARAADSEGYVSLDTIRALGIGARFERTELTLYLEIPAEIRRVEIISLRGGDPGRPGVTDVYPALVSGFVNARGVVDYVGTGPTGTERGRQPARVELDGAANGADWVLEGRLAWVEGAEHFWQRGESRLVRDFPSQSVRFEAGDLSLPIAGFQNRRPMAGVSFGTQFDLQPYRVFEPAGTREFTLDRPSDVYVFVNGRRVRSLRLLPGRYDVRDFRFSNGVNDVRIVIEDDLGRVRELDFGFAFEPSLLAPGTHEFSYAVGFPSSVDRGLVEYERERTTFSAFHRYGITDDLTLGTNLQSDVDQWVGGAEITWASGAGTLRADAAFARGDRQQDDYAARLRYDYADQTAANIYRRRFGMTVESRGEGFAPLGSPPGANPVAVEIAASVGQDVLSPTLRASIDGRYSVGRGGETDASVLGVTLQKRVGFAELDVTIERAWSSAGERDLRSLVSVTFTGWPRNHTVRAGHDSSDHSTQLDWQYTPSDVIGGVGANARLTRRPFQNELSGSVQYVGSRLEADVLHDAVFKTRSEGTPQQRSTLRFGTAVAFAGKRLALSRPISNSFAMVVPHAALEGMRIGVDRAGSSSPANADRFGPAVLPNLTPYQIRPVTIDAPDLPPGVDLGQSYFQARPTYKSGVLIPVGTDATAVARGNLSTPDGQPVVLQAGTLVSLLEPDAPSRTVFTNRSGTFRCSGIKPGPYELIMHSAPHARIGFSVPAGTVGEYELGRILLPEGALRR